MSVIDDIAKERQRQISKEGWTLAHDDEHDRGELADAAACYAATTRAFKAEEFAGVGYRTYTSYSDLWPKSWADHWFKPKKARRRKLVIAAALLVAEIERLDRAVLSHVPHSSPEPRSHGGGTRQMSDAAKANTIEKARVMLGIPRPNADALVALLCAWDMGYRTPASLSHMAGKMLREDASPPTPGSREELLARSDKYLNTGSGEYASDIMRDMAEFIRRLPDAAGAAQASEVSGYRAALEQIAARVAKKAPAGLRIICPVCAYKSVEPHTEARHAPNCAGEIARAALAVTSTNRVCARCGCETQGEEALVNGKIWCHPCADSVAHTGPHGKAGA